MAFNGDIRLQSIILKLMNTCTAFVETGTGTGDSSAFVARHAPKPVLTCDVNPHQLDIARRSLPSRVLVYEMSSEKFVAAVKRQVGDLPLFFLDAHWQDYWPLLDELRAIGSYYERAVVIVHDFQVLGNDAFGYCVGGGGEVGVTRSEPGEGVCNLEYIAPVLAETGQAYRLYFPDYEPAERAPGYVVIFQGVEPFGVEGLKKHE
jgi:hypothetical protein